MIREGVTAPEFALPGTDSSADTDVGRYRLTDALQQGPVLLSFYLFDFHPACTTALCDLHDLAWFDIDESVTVFGISTDRSYSHQAFAEAERLGYTLLSDSDGSVAESYGVLYDEFREHKRIAKRSVFLVDTDRTIRYAWSTDDPAEQPRWAEVGEAIEAVDAAT
ncbi:alkyl hydroperoxide reductase [Halobellus sp. Atlit-31R]|nr:alkyl hydroperoxide reductase [Halobellus sp. Atlit-31R]